MSRGLKHPVPTTIGHGLSKILARVDETWSILMRSYRLVIAVAVILALAFLLTLSSPFIGGW
jgi:hypothetical protein